MKTEIICFANNKGGSGKSTTCANVAYSLSTMGKRVLVIDADMQMNLSLSFFEEEKVLKMNAGGCNLYGCLKDGRPLNECIYETEYEGLKLMPSSMLMSGMEEFIFERGGSIQMFSGAMKEIRTSGDFDYILLDAPPTLGVWVRNLLCFAQKVVIPVEASPWGLFGLANMVDYVKNAQSINKKLKICGIVITKADARKNYLKQTEELLQNMGNIPVFSSIIRVDSNIEWAQDNSMPVGAYIRSSRSAREYMALAEEIAASK